MPSKPLEVPARPQTDGRQETPLMAAFLTIAPSCREQIRVWVFRGHLLGDPLPTGSDPLALYFEQRWRTASSEEQKLFRRDLIASENQGKTRQEHL